MEYEETTVHVTDRYSYHQAEEGYIIPNTENLSKHEQDDNDSAWNVQDLKFHSDWNWIMPVMNKCREINDEYKEIWKASSYEIDRRNHIDMDFKFKNIMIYVMYVDPERTFIEVIKFIKELTNVKNGSNEGVQN